MGFQDCLHLMRTPYASPAAVEFADRSMEAVCYHAYWASTELAQERGRYSSYKGSLWDSGILPQDTLKLLKEERGGYVEIDDSSTLDWEALRARIKEHGMRNSNCVAIAPTATISNIIGVAASIEPEYQNIYVKSNLSGEFTVVNEQLVRDLKEIGQWDEVMVSDLKYFDGSLAKIDRVPAEMRELYATAFEVETKWIVEAGARRQKWIDQAQSHVLLANAGGDVGREVDRARRRAQRGVGALERRRCGQGCGARRGRACAQGLPHQRPYVRGVPMNFGHAPRWEVAIANASAAKVKRAARAAIAHDPTCGACQ
jgi:ribonucleoside-diphosphate reductase alpha chain